MSLSYQAFLAEAFNSEPYPFELEDKSTSMDRFFIIATETGDRYRLWFEVQKKMGAKVMRVVIGQATPNAKVFKKIVQKFNNPLRLFATMMEIFRDGVKNDQYMRGQDGFAVAIPKEAFGNVANAASNIASRAMRGTMFESVSGVTFKDTDFEYITFARKGKAVADVFDGSNAQVVPKAGSVPTSLAAQTADVLATGVAAPKVIGKSTKPLQDLAFAATDIEGSKQQGQTNTDTYASRAVRVKDTEAAKKHAEAVLLANGFKFKRKNLVSDAAEYTSPKMSAEVYTEPGTLYVSVKSEVAAANANPIIAAAKAAPQSNSDFGLMTFELAKAPGQTQYIAINWVKVFDPKDPNKKVLNVWAWTKNGNMRSDMNLANFMHLSPQQGTKAKRDELHNALTQAYLQSGGGKNKVLAALRNTTKVQEWQVSK